MATPPSKLTRRNFLHRAGLLVTAVGISGTVHSGLMDQITKKAVRKWGTDALAQTPSSVKYLVEICYRLGAQVNAMFPSAGHRTPIGSQNPDLNIYSSPNNIIPLNRDGRDTYFASFTAGQGIDRLRTVLATTPGLETVGVAASEAIGLQTGQHTSNFASRAPTGVAVCPAVLHAGSYAPARPVQGIAWGIGIDNGTVDNQRSAAYPSLDRVSSRGQFQSLFRELPMFFTRDELRLIVGSFDNQGSLMAGQEGALHRIDSMWRSAQDPRTGVFNDNDTIVANSIGGRNQSTLSLAEQLDETYTTIQPNFGATIDNPNGGAALGQALASAAAAFSLGASSTFMVALDMGDWHTDIQAFDTAASKQGQMNIVHGNALAGLWQSAAALPDPDGDGTIADHLLVKITSEFTRTALRQQNGADNGDGGTAGVVWMGKRVKNGSFGNIGGDGTITGFDSASGNLAGGPLRTEMQAYRTTLKMMGADSMAGAFGVGSAMPLDAVIK